MAQKRMARSSKRFPIILLSLLVGGGWWLWETDTATNWKERILAYVNNYDIVTFEAQFLPQQLVEENRQKLLGNDQKTLQGATLKYTPYLLLNVKYSEGGKTREGVLLWGLSDGEMVLNTETWETTHGFRDCLECRAGRNDFKVIQTLARHQGALGIENLQRELKMEPELVSAWIESTKKKGLVTQKGNLLQLHFENPKLLVTPLTTITKDLVSKPLGEGEKVAKTYSRNQIFSITQAAFGDDFKIRKEQEIFLPIYSIEILNSDGSIHTSEWNALTGQQIILL